MRDSSPVIRPENLPEKELDQKTGPFLFKIYKNGRFKSCHCTSLALFTSEKRRLKERVSKPKTLTLYDKETLYGLERMKVLSCTHDDRQRDDDNKIGTFHEVQCLGRVVAPVSGTGC